MKGLLARLRDANDGLEAYLTASAEHLPVPTNEAGWETLARVAEKVHGLGPSLSELPSCLIDVGVQNELRRYKTNITRLQRRCEDAVAELESHRREIWREEQALRSQQRWQTESTR